MPEEVPVGDHPADAASDNSTKTWSKPSSESTSVIDTRSSTPEQEATRGIPMFRPIHAEDARARAAVEQWRTFTMLLEPQVDVLL